MMKTADNLQFQLLQVVEDLSPVQQAEVLDFALFLKERQLAWGWDSISDDRAAALKAEFAAEDTAFSEAILTDYPDLLKREDVA
jgi:hypothetical protein